MYFVLGAPQLPDGHIVTFLDRLYVSSRNALLGSFAGTQS